MRSRLNRLQAVFRGCLGTLAQRRGPTRTSDIEEALGGCQRSRDDPATTTSQGYVVPRLVLPTEVLSNGFDGFDTVLSPEIFARETLQHASNFNSKPRF